MLLQQLMIGQAVRDMTCASTAQLLYGYITQIRTLKLIHPPCLMLPCTRNASAC